MTYRPAPLIRYLSLTAFLASPPPATRAWTCVIEGVTYAGIGTSGMARLLWSGLWVPTAEIPDSAITRTVGDASQVSRDGSNRLVLDVDGTNASLDEVEVSFQPLLGLVRFPGSLAAQAQVTGGTPATNNKFSVRCSDGTLYQSSSLQKAASGWERDMYDNAGTAVTAVALAQDPTAAFMTTVYQAVARFPQRLQGAGNQFILDTYGNNTGMGLVPAGNNWDLQAATTVTAGLRLYLDAVTAGAGTLEVTISHIQATLAPGLRDPWI